MKREGLLVSEARARRFTRRSVAIALGIAALCGALGVVHGISQRLVDIAAAEVGAIRIEAAGGAAAMDGALGDALSPGVSEKIRSVLGAYAEAADAVPRLQFDSQFEQGAQLGDVSIVGIDPANRLPASYEIVQGSDLQPGDYPAVLVGEALASELAVVPGDYLWVLSPTPGACGVKPTTRLRIEGVYRGGGELPDGHVVYLPLRMAQHIADTEGVSRYDLLLTDVARANEIAAAMRSALTAASASVVVWPEAGLPVRYRVALALVAVTRWATPLGVILLLILLLLLGFAMAGASWTIRPSLVPGLFRDERRRVPTPLGRGQVVRVQVRLD